MTKISVISDVHNFANLLNNIDIKKFVTTYDVGVPSGDAIGVIAHQSNGMYKSSYLPHHQTDYDICSMYWRINPMYEYHRSDYERRVHQTNKNVSKFKTKQIPSNTTTKHGTPYWSLLNKL